MLFDEEKVINGLLYIVILVTIVTVFYFLGVESLATRVAKDQVYEEMVCIWRADADKGIPENDRAGWPNYEHRNINCEQIYTRDPRDYPRVDTRDTSELHKGRPYTGSW